MVAVFFLAPERSNGLLHGMNFRCILAVLTIFSLFSLAPTATAGSLGAELLKGFFKALSGKKGQPTAYRSSPSSPPTAPRSASPATIPSGQKAAPPKGSAGDPGTGATIPPVPKASAYGSLPASSINSPPAKQYASPVGPSTALRAAYPSPKGSVVPIPGATTSTVPQGRTSGNVPTNSGNSFSTEQARLKDSQQKSIDDIPRKYAPNNSYSAKGGAYGNLKGQPGFEAHHMPAASINSLPTKIGPAIQMTPSDHSQTASWGASAQARAFREKQLTLIKQGRFKAAQQMDIDDIRNKFGDKYDAQIIQMQRYTETLGTK
jgi:hypothetical protein